MTVQKVVCLVALCAVLCGVGSNAFGDLTWSKVDLLPNLWPDSTPLGYGLPCEVFNASATYNVSTDTITITINTNFAESGFLATHGGDSYYDVALADGTPTSDPRDPDGKVFRAGDLYIGYAPDGDIWNAEEVFAVGMTDHDGNVVQQAYTDDANWGTVEKGHIYSTPTSDILLDWATGTYEGYDQETPDAIPPDADSSGLPVAENGLATRLTDTETDPGTGEFLYTNTYPTLLKDPTADIGLASVEWVANPDHSWPNRIGLWDIVIEFSAADLGLVGEDIRDLSFFWSQECGNDGVLLSAPMGEAIPEPATILLLAGIGLGAVAHTRRKK